MEASRWYRYCPDQNLWPNDHRPVGIGGGGARGGGVPPPPIICTNMPPPPPKKKKKIKKKWSVILKKNYVCPPPPPQSVIAFYVCPPICNCFLRAWIKNTAVDFMPPEVETNDFLVVHVYMVKCFRDVVSLFE